MATALRREWPDAVAEADGWLSAQAGKDLLRFITCGSVDDGKSTLIGRLLHDARQLPDDQYEALVLGGGSDFASLVDGLAAEREQGITIDVAYRYFATARRKFITADTPGHEQYTRNMATGASTADLAVILVDARKGVLTQTRRHSHIVDRLGIRHVVLAVNKMDLVGYDESVFDRIVADYHAFAAAAGIGEFNAIPISGLAGDNVVERSTNMHWYRGPALLEHLETVRLERVAVAGFRMPVQWVNRPDQDFRGLAGTIASGEARVGAEVRIEPSGRRSRIARIVTYDGDLDVAVAGKAVTLVLADEVDCSRGDVIAGVGAGLAVRDRFEAELVWMAHEPLVPGRAYWLKIGTRTVPASVSRVSALHDVDTMQRKAGRPLALNDIGRCDIVLDRPVAALTYAESRTLGGFILIDRASHATVAAGMIAHFPDGASAVERSDAGRIVWLTGAPAAERREFARRAQDRLRARGRPTLILDACALREGLSRDLGFSAEDEAENRRRTAEVAKLLSGAGVTVLVALDAPEGGAVAGAKVDIKDAGDGWDWMI
jgi:bifunctional enzyme CysN/CysC